MATVIKAGETAARPARLTPVELVDHMAEARSVIEQAHAQASRILADARRKTESDAQHALAAAREEGYQAGLTRGSEEGRAAGFESAHKEAAERFAAEHAECVARMDRAAEVFVQAAQRIDAVKAELRGMAEADLLEFAVRVASRLTKEVGRTDRDAATANLRRALALIESGAQVSVRVHPDDLDALRQYSEARSAEAEASHTVRLQPDQSIAPGGCVVQSERTTVDASLDTQIAELVALLLGTEPRHG